MEEFTAHIGIPAFMQLTIECWNGLFLLIMIVMMIIRRQPDETGRAYNVKVPLTGEILTFYIAVFLYDLFDIICTVSYGDTSYTGFIIYAASEFAYYTTGAFQTLFFLQLVKTQVAGRNGMKWLKYLTTAFQLLHLPCIILLAATPFTGALYYFDEFNHYNRGEFYSVWYYATVASFIYIINVIFFNRKKNDRFFVKICVTAGVIPLIAFLINFVYRGISINNISVSITALIIFVMYEKFRSDMLVSGIKKAEIVSRELAEKKAELEQSKSKILMAQIRSHFILNSITAIGSYLDEPEKAENALAHFARFLRSSVDVLEENGCIRAEREFATVNDYLYIEKARFGKKLTVVTEIADDDFFIPAFSVQTLAENAVNHGIRENHEGKGTVRIRSYETETEHIVEVRDDGKGFDPESGAPKNDGRSHIGLSNLRSRLSGMCGGTLDIESQIGKGTTARIHIPKNTKIFTEGNENEHTDS
ncbi:MAG: histidine kinase [Ruminiclostridium sp.]|nr:histidine kinase [Ruminiclostridium sp.]